jgi:hypothetical protein
MIEINPRAFYTHADLMEMFAKVNINWQATLSPRLKVRKVHNKAVWGQHLIEALDAAGKVEPEPAPKVEPPKKSKPKTTGPKRKTLLDIAIEEIEAEEAAKAAKKGRSIQ